MKIVCICEDETSVQTVLCGLANFDVPLLILPDYDSKKRKPKPVRNSRLIQRVINKAFFKVAPRKPSKQRIESLLTESTSKLKKEQFKNVVKIPVGKINSQSTADLIESYNPDLLFVCGAPILKKKIFDIPKFGAINFHYGFSPVYQGQHTLLWAYMRGDYERIGGTFLRIDSGVDTGQPLAFIYPEVKGLDSIETVESKLAQLAHEQIGEVMQLTQTDTPPRESAEYQNSMSIKYNDYSPLVHLRYLFNYWRNRLFSKSTVLREQQVDILF